MTPQQRMEFADAWESLRARVLDASPRAAAVIASIPGLHWPDTPATERQVLLAAAFAGSDPGVPAVRRQLREAVITALGGGSNSPESTGRRAVPSLAQLAAVGEPGLPEALARASNPLEAVDALRGRLRGLGFQRATRFLSLLGYPVIDPDAGKVRWLRRMGLIAEGGASVAELRAALSVLLDLAASVQSTPREFDTILAEFTAEGDSGTCSRKARCAACPIAGACPTGRAASFSTESGQATGALTLSEAMPLADRPREKLAARGAGALSDSELIAILLRTGSGRENAVALANRLMMEFGGLDRLSRASVAELASRRGVGSVKAVTIKAALELARRLDAGDPREALAVTSSQAIFPLLRKRFLGAMREEFVVVMLNTKNIVTRVASVSEGILNQSLVHPREAFAEAIRDSAAAVIFSHNHPSGDPTPSRDDMVITERLVKAGDILGIRVLDHIVVGSEGFYSFADNGRLKGGS